MRLLTAIIYLALAGECFAQGGKSMDADDIMRRALARRLEGRMASFSAAVHTTSSVDIISNGSLVTVIPNSSAVEESDGMLYYDPALGTRIRINAHRATARSSGMGRTIVEDFEMLGNYFTIDDDRVVLLNTSIASPLAQDALEHYKYTLANRLNRSGVAVYEIDVQPVSRLYPGFAGKLWITQGNYDVAAVDLAPSEETAIPFVHDLHLAMRFAPADDGRYEPASVELTGHGDVRVVAFGLANSAVDFEMRTMFTDPRTNVTMPDSIRMQTRPVIVDGGAETLGTSYWARRSQLGSEQIATLDESWRKSGTGAPIMSIGPYIDYNRAGGVALGVTPGKTLGPVAFTGFGAYSFGLARPIGEANATLTIAHDSSFNMAVRGGVYSSLSVMTTGDRAYPNIMNSLVVATLHQDYYDYFRKDGFRAGADFAYDLYSLALTYERSQQFSVGNNARWSVLTFNSKEFPANRPIEEGSYETVQADLASGRVAPFLKITPVGGLDFRWSLSGLLGRDRTTDVSFGLGEALASLSIPVVQTGYTPMTLTLLGAAGSGTATLPTQYQFRLRTSAATFGKPGGFVSPPKGLYGGTGYQAVGAEFNLTDLPWRAIGLPTYNGRGIELILAGGSGRYEQHHELGYSGTGDNWYSEAGFAVSRIPLFLTDLVYGRVDMRWGIGPLGQFGANFTLVAPM